MVQVEQSVMRYLKGQNMPEKHLSGRIKRGDDRERYGGEVDGKS